MKCEKETYETKMNTTNLDLVVVKVELRLVIENVGAGVNDCDWSRCRLRWRNVVRKATRDDGRTMEPKIK